VIIDMRKFETNILDGYFGRVQKEHSIKINESIDVNVAIYTIRKMASETGFNETNEVLLATATSELAVNILRYADRGEIVLRVIEGWDTKKSGIELIALDKGPGIEDVEKALSEFYTTYESSLGQGLPSVVRIMDDFKIESIQDIGTMIIACKWSL